MYLKLIIITLLVLNISADSINENRSNQWMQSLEYHLLCKQIFESAKNRFDSLDLNNTHSVILEKSPEENLPLAIITDIDETILSNYEFQLHTRKNGGKFSYDSFEEYIKKKTAFPIHGSIEYYNYLADKGIKVIYISNRHISSENKTFEHLKELGFPINNKNELILKNEKKEWSSDKSSRRAYIAKKYKVIQLFGDNLKDFSHSQEQIAKNKKLFGKSWFLLPNPTYGSWLKTYEGK